MKFCHKLLEILPNCKDLKSHPGFFGVVDPPARFTEIVFVCVPIYLCLSVRTHVSKIVIGKSSFYVRSKSEMKSVLNFCTGKLCSEVVSFRRSEIRVWQLSSQTL